VKARELFARDRDYIIQDGALSLVDAFTGRVLQGRRFSDGLQQALEAKESLKVSADTQVVAKVTYQFLFRLFPKLAGMTGTALSDSAEFFETYQLRVFPVPTALPVARRDYPDAVFRSQEGRMRALLRNVLGRHESPWLRAADADAARHRQILFFLRWCDKRNKIEMFIFKKVITDCKELRLKLH
jgi:preprotein translocase subunit SecA